MHEPPEREAVDRNSSRLPLTAWARLRFQLTLFRLCPRFPFAADGVAAQLSAAGLTNELESLLEIRDLAISVALVRLGLVFRGGRLTELVGSFATPFVKGLLGSSAGTF